MSLSYDGKTLKLYLDAPRNKASAVFSTIMKNIPDAWKDITWEGTATLTPSARSQWIWAARSGLTQQIVKDIFEKGGAECVRTLARLAMISTEPLRAYSTVSADDCENEAARVAMWGWEKIAPDCPSLYIFAEKTLSELPLPRLVTVWKFVQCGWSCYHQFARLVPAAAIPVLIPMIPTVFQRFQNQMGPQEIHTRWTAWILSERLRSTEAEKNRYMLQLPKLK